MMCSRWLSNHAFLGRDWPRGLFHSQDHRKVAPSCCPHSCPSCYGPASRCCWGADTTVAASPPALCPWTQFLQWPARWRPGRTPEFRNPGKAPGRIWLCNLRRECHKEPAQLKCNWEHNSYKVLLNRSSYAKHFLRNKIKLFIPSGRNNIYNHQYPSMAVYVVHLYMLLFSDGINRLILFWKLKHNGLLSINPLKTKRRPLYLKPMSVPRCKHFSSRL